MEESLYKQDQIQQEMKQFYQKELQNQLALNSSQLKASFEVEVANQKQAWQQQHDVQVVNSSKSYLVKWKNC